jgi:sugar lactone lactonase YvrE
MFRSLWNRGRVRRIAPILAAALCAAACTTGSIGPAPTSEVYVPTPGPSQQPRSWAGSDPAPPFPDGLAWFNVRSPLTLRDLRGKVVVLDFWTLGCINCQHIIPDLKRLEAEFGDALAVIGVHSGKYDTEHDDTSIREAIRRYGLEHPVVNDPDFIFWRRFGARAWPTLVIIDPAGNLVGYHAGEGVYPLFQPILASLVAEFEAAGTIDRTPLPIAGEAAAVATILRYPADVVADEAAGRLYIADSGHNRILVATLDGALERVIGDGTEGFADGAAAEARFRQPQGLGLSSDGRTLFVADTRNHAVRAVDLATGDVTTIAGTGAQLERLPGPGARGRDSALASPWDVVERHGRLYISMAGVHQVWVLDLASGLIEPFAGTSREGVDDGDRRTMATLAQPSGIDAGGEQLYWVDPEGSAVRRLPLDGSGPVETLAGTGLFDFGDIDGDRRSARLQHPQGIAVAAGRLFIADTYNHKIKLVDPERGGATTFAGSERGRADGPADAARFDEPAGLSVAHGRLYVADTNNHAIRVVDIETGETSTLRLSNLEVAAPRDGGLPREVLPRVQAAPGVSTLRVTISAPAGHHLNALAPGKLSLSVADPGVLRLGEHDLSWSSDDAFVSLIVPVELSPGETTLTGVLQAYYCLDGAEALCFVHRAELALPVNVAGGTAAGIRLDYLLPSGP